MGGFWRVIGSAPQRSRSHDLRLSYTSASASFAVTLFGQTLTSVRAYLGTARPVIGQIDGVRSGSRSS